MSINEIIEKKYYILQKMCRKNVIQQVEKVQGIRDIEDIDLLHSILIRMLIKYKGVEFTDVDDGFSIIKKNFLGEKNKYSKMRKPNTKILISISDPGMRNQLNVNKIGSGIDPIVT